MNESAAPKIESQDLSVGALFKDFYSVPDFQREYVWQSEHVERLLQDLYDEFYEDGQPLSGPEYFLGSIVACKGRDGTFQLIDGQQRMPIKSLLEKPQAGVNSQLNRAVEELIPFDIWDSAAIERRREMLCKLARKVWDMPERKEEMAL